MESSSYRSIQITKISLQIFYFNIDKVDQRVEVKNRKRSMYLKIKQMGYVPGGLYVRVHSGPRKPPD